MNRTNILSFIISSDSLDSHKHDDSCLNKLIELIEISPEIWRTDDSISITSPPPMSAAHYKEIYERRLSRIPDTSEMTTTKNSTEALVNYCRNNPNANIWGIIFNCSLHSYWVFCGQDNDELEVISVIVKNNY